MIIKRIIFVFILSLSSHLICADYSLKQETRLAEINGISIAYTTAGNREDPAVLMIMGLMASHKVWGEEIVNSLVDSGYQVILLTTEIREILRS